MSDTDAASAPLHARRMPTPGSAEVLDAATIDGALSELEGWDRDGDAILRRFAFEHWPETLVFVNAAGWLAHRVDHHPDLAVGYKHCEVRLSTHSAGGITWMDLITAARLNRLARGE